MASSCALKTAMLMSYSDAASKYCQAVTELDEQVGYVPRGEYERIHNLTEEARLSVERARLAMEEHVRQHGC